MGRYHFDGHTLFLKCIGLVEGYDTSLFYIEMPHGFDVTRCIPFQNFHRRWSGMPVRLLLPCFFHRNEITFSMTLVIEDLPVFPA